MTNKIGAGVAIVLAILALSVGVAHAGPPQQTGSRCGELVYNEGELWEWVCIEPPDPSFGFWVRWGGEQYGYAIAETAYAAANTVYWGWWGAYTTPWWEPAPSYDWLYLNPYVWVW